MATDHPKTVEINSEFFVVYPASQIEEAKAAQEKGYNVLLEQVDPVSGNTLLDNLFYFQRRAALKSK